MFLGVEIGGTKVQWALGDGRGSLRQVAGRRADPDRGAQGILELLRAEVPRALADTPKMDPVQAIGVGFGGPVDSVRGRTIVCHHMIGWTDLSLREWFQEAFALPTLVANDSNAAGWAEFRLGAGRGAQNMAYINIGSGIGGALVIDGRLCDGQGYGAGEIGHTFIPVPAESGEGFTADKLEHYCSGWAIERRARCQWSADRTSVLGRIVEGDRERITCSVLAAAATAGDPFARKAIADAARAVGLAVGNLCSLFCPEKLVLGGGVSGMGELLLAPLRRHARDYTIDSLQGRTDIVLSELGQEVVPQGAILLAQEAFGEPV